jgi:hypothetical protein
MKQLLYFFSKTDPGIISHCPESTKNIHATFGFFVLMTGIMAFISGSYAISNMFIHEDPATGQPAMIKHGWLYAFILGSIYASFIMAIDREIVSASSKWAAIFRIPLAVVISLVVSIPVELQIFEGKINRHLIKQHQDDNDVLKNKLVDRNRITQLEGDIKKTESLKQGAIDKRDNWAEAIEAEVVGRVKAGRTGKAGRGPAYAEALMNKNLQETMIGKYNDELTTKKEELVAAKKKNETEFENERVAQSFDLLSKYIALKEIKKEDTTGSATGMGLGVTLLFCLFELIPSIMKILTPPTEYDVLLDKRRRLNISATKLIYQQVNMEYRNKTVDEIVEYNPQAVQKMFEAQSC